MEFVFIGLGPITYLLFLKDIKQKYSIKWLDKYLFISFAIITGLLIIFNLRAMYTVLFIARFNLIIAIVYSLYILIRAALEKNKKAIILLVGNILICSDIIIDTIFVSFNIIDPNLSRFGHCHECIHSLSRKRHSP